MWFLEKDLANFSDLRALRWNPAKVMNYQQYPNFPKSLQKEAIWVSFMSKADQLKEGDKLYPMNFSGWAALTILANLLAIWIEGAGVSIQIMSAYFKNSLALAAHNSTHPLME